MKGIERAILAIVILLTLTLLAFDLNPILNQERLPFIYLVPVFALFSFFHATALLGWIRALTFLAVSAVLSLAAELIGTMTGSLFGSYYYTDVLGPKLFGEVPLVIPLTWFLMMYPSYIIANLVTYEKPIVETSRWQPLVWLSLIGAMVMTAWDLTLDPYMVMFEKAWVWEDGGPYFGIPFENYVGWLLTTFVVFVVYRWLERRVESRPITAPKPWFVALPLLTYGFMSLGDMLFGQPEATILISPFVMGMPLLFAGTALFDWRRKQRAAR